MVKEIFALCSLLSLCAITCKLSCSRRAERYARSRFAVHTELSIPRRSPPGSVFGTERARAPFNRPCRATLFNCLPRGMQKSRMVACARSVSESFLTARVRAGLIICGARGLSRALKGNVTGLRDASFQPRRATRIREISLLTDLIADPRADYWLRTSRSFLSKQAS